MKTPNSTVTLVVPSEFEFDKIKDEWEEIWWDGSMLHADLHLTRHMEGDEKMIDGNRMLKYVLEMGAGGCDQHDAERLLKQQDTIPEDWKSFTLLFTDTIWRDKKGFLYYPCLADNGEGKWEIGFYCLSLGFGSICPSRIVWKLAL